MDSAISNDSEKPLKLDTHLEPTNKPKLRAKSLKKLVYNLNCMNHRLSTSIENATKETNYDKSLSSEDSYNKSTSSGGYYEICYRDSISTEGVYEEIRYNSLYDTVGNINVPNGNENEFDSSKNSKESNSLQNLTYDVLEMTESDSQHKAKDAVKPALPVKPPHLSKVSSKCAKVDIAASYHRLEELSSKSEITSKDVQETLRIVKELENLFHDKVNVILNKFKDN
nr:unnamed protein product [Callosobruchus chinensis]